ncbi:histidine phosphatase family protein [Capillimicrobium parvum]|uniref:Acid phosphatase n=1 Tax=Capillimicrobium parvum TaxID=2884022 RepID=A0A9E6XV74_9ACTN|nr:histidine phosphatase family protein [Capillimicrobium parvum]UGS34795.1 Acid phosphatase [Capillimicrobium parvum]
MADAPPELWLARHGDTAWTVSRQHTGTTDLELNEAGVDAARALRSKLDGRRYDLVLSSPLRRALDTAHLAGFEPEVEARLREFDYGEYEGVTTAQIHETRPDWDLWRDGSPGGETPDDVGRRMDEVIADIRDRAGERALVFGHGHALRVLTARWLGLPAAEGRRFLLGPAGVGVLGSEHGAAAVARWGV